MQEANYRNMIPLSTNRRIKFEIVESEGQARLKLTGNQDRLKIGISSANQSYYCFHHRKCNTMYFECYIIAHHYNLQPQTTTMATMRTSMLTARVGWIKVPLSMPNSASPNSYSLLPLLALEGWRRIGNRGIQTLSYNILYF
jgi:hypothetical protein